MGHDEPWQCEMLLGVVTGTFAFGSMVDIRMVAVDVAVGAAVGNILD